MNQLSRDNKYDNLKGIMILLVLFCHFLDKMTSSVQNDIFVRYLYCFVYLFHMPVFVFISGFFSKNDGSNGYFKKTIRYCLIPYLIFNFIYSMLQSQGYIWKSLLEFPYPQWTLWYLLSLCIWKLLAKPVSMLRWPILMSVLVSLYVGFIQLGKLLAFTRTFSFFPYFLAGYLLPKQTVEKVRDWKNNHRKIFLYIVFPFLFALAVLFFIRKLNVDISALYMQDPYSGMSSMAAVGTRLLLILTGFACIGGFIAIAPEKHSILSVIGKNSIVIYLVHSGIIRGLTKFTELNLDNSLISIGSAVIFAVTVCLLFGNEPIAKAYRFVIGHISSIFIKPEKQ